MSISAPLFPCCEICGDEIELVWGRTPFSVGDGSVVCSDCYADPTNTDADCLTEAL